MSNKDSFLSSLYEKKSAVLSIQESTGKKMDSAVNEVDRQIRQALTGDNPIKGEGVTKSGGDD